MEKNYKQIKIKQKAGIYDTHNLIVLIATDDDEIIGVTTYEYPKTQQCRLIVLFSPLKIIKIKTIFP